MGRISKEAIQKRRLEQGLRKDPYRQPRRRSLRLQPEIRRPRNVNPEREGQQEIPIIDLTGEDEDLVDLTGGNEDGSTSSGEKEKKVE